MAGEWLDPTAKIFGLVGLGVGALGAMVQYIINSRAERRQRELAVLESDIKISAVFSDLVQIANGYGGRSEPQEELIKIIEKNLPPDLLATALQRDPRYVGQLFSGALIPTGTPLAAQLAAAESIANLAIRYPILREPALASLDVVVAFMPQARPAFDRLRQHYADKRPLTNWGPNWQGVADQQVGHAPKPKRDP